jgi:two-component system sensor histidine kinase HydH
MQRRARGGLALWGLLIGAVSGVIDTMILLALGIDLHVAGRDVTVPVALYLSTTFALLCAAVGHFIDARTQARRDAETIRRQLDELETSRRAAAQAEKLAAIGRLAAGVAHEVRNPLGVIRASACMVQESFDPGTESHRACGFICEEIDRLNGLIASLLSFARPTEPRLERVFVDKLFDRVLALAAGDLERRGIEIERDGGSGASLRADPDLLAQMLLGLVTNAAEATSRGGRIELRAQADARRVRFEVADSGPGISLEDAERIFEPFYTTKATGTGLGLAMTARIVEGHGGQIQLLQERGAGGAGRGACFRVEVPAAGPCESAAPALSDARSDPNAA